MTPQAVLTELLDRIGARQGDAVRIRNDELRVWPVDAVAALKSARLLTKARPASSIVCPGCEKQCLMPIDVLAAEDDRPARAFIVCDKPDDLGRISVELSMLEQWKMTGGALASAVAPMLGFNKQPPRLDNTGKFWTLGLVDGREDKGAMTLSIEGGVTLTLDGKSIPLAHALTLDERGLRANKDALLRITDGDTRQPASGIGSTAWRTQTAKAAAVARHSQPGGSREKRKQMRAAWASGKYTTRDICAEQEYAALGVSFSAARKALRNTPEPKRT